VTSLPSGQPASAEIVLCTGSLAVGIVPGAGGSLSRLRVKTANHWCDILRPACPGPQPLAPSLGMACFPLVPYCGRLRHGRFPFDGRTVVHRLNAAPEPHSSHGDGFTASWSLVSHEMHRAVLRFETSAAAALHYECTETIAVRPGRVDITLAARNLESRPIPMELGFHPYFANRAGARLTALLATQTFWDSELMPVSTGPNGLQRELAAGIAAGRLPEAAEFGQWDGKALIEWPTSGVGVRLNTQPPLANVVIWTPACEDFFCFEPLSHPTDSFNRCLSDPAIPAPTRLLPGETREQTCSMQVFISGVP
jgi:aldose 1-epimerase